MFKTPSLPSGVLSVALLAAYVVLTVLNHDGTVLLGALLGQLGGSAVEASVPPKAP